MNDEHIAKAREMFLDCDHPVAGHICVNGNPVKLMESMPRLRRPAPTLGQDNEAVYEGVFGLSPERFAQLKDEGII